MSELFNLVGLTLWIWQPQKVEIYAYDFPHLLPAYVSGMTEIETRNRYENWNGQEQVWGGSSYFLGLNRTTGGNCGNGIPNSVTVELTPGYRYYVRAVSNECTVWEVFIADLRCNDINADTYVDGLDYDRFMAWFEQGFAGADINEDGFVDGIDYDTFQNQWLSGC